MEFSQDVLVDFLLRSGGEVSNSALLQHFKPLFPQDPQGRASMRDTFKKCVDSVAVVRTHGGERYVCLKKRFRPPTEQNRTGSDPERSVKGETATCTSSGDDAAQPPRASTPGSDSGSDVQVCVPHASTCVSEVCEEQHSAGQMGNRGSSRHSDRGSRKEVVILKPPDIPDIPVIAVIQASPLPAEAAVFNLPEPAETGTTLPEASGCRLTCGGRGAAESGDEAADSGDEVYLDARDLSDEESPKGSRRHFIQVMMNSSPDVRRSMVLRNWDPECLHCEDAGDSASLASSVEEERAAVTLDPVEHEWMMCASDGEWHSLQRLLEDDPGLVLKKDFVTGFTCLHWAAKHGKPELIALIVNFARQHRVPLSVDVRSNSGYTPLHVAAMHHHMEVVKLLVGAYSADVEVRDYSGRKACQYLKDGVSGDIQDIVGASRGSKDRQEALRGEDGGRWRLSRVLQSNLKPLRTLHAGDSVDGDEPVLRRRASFSRVKPKLQKLRNRTSQLVHSATFHGRDDLEASRKGSFRFRPKTNFFG